MMEFTVDGTVNRGYIALPESGSGSGILVLHAWWGLTPFFTNVCDRLAAEGFVAFAPDLYNGKTARTRDEAQQLRSELDFEETQATVSAAVGALHDHPGVQGTGVGVLGCSMGAAWAIQLATLAPHHIAAVVAFYGAVYGPEGPDFAQAKAPFLGHYAEQDDVDPLEDVRQMEAEMRAAGVDVTLHIYPHVGHWFFEADQPDYYNAQAAALAWDRTVEFLRHHLSQT